MRPGGLTAASVLLCRRFSTLGSSFVQPVLLPDDAPTKQYSQQMLLLLLLLMLWIKLEVLIRPMIMTPTILVSYKVPAAWSSGLVVLVLTRIVYLLSDTSPVIQSSLKNTSISSRTRISTKTLEILKIASLPTKNRDVASGRTFFSCRIFFFCTVEFNLPIFCGFSNIV